MCVPNAWRPLSAPRHSNRTAGHSTKNWMRRERTQVDWQCGSVHCVLIQVLENLSKHSYNWCHSVILVSCRWVQGPASWSSTNFLLAIVSNAEPLKSLRLFSWASRGSQFCFNYCSCRSWWSCRSCSSPWWARQIFFFLRLNRFIQFFV